MIFGSSVFTIMSSCQYCSPNDTWGRLIEILSYIVVLECTKGIHISEKALSGRVHFISTGAYPKLTNCTSQLRRKGQLIRSPRIDCHSLTYAPATVAQAQNPPSGRAVSEAGGFPSTRSGVCPNAFSSSVEASAEYLLSAGSALCSTSLTALWGGGSMRREM
jgi:hypothetical protein